MNVTNVPLWERRILLPIERAQPAFWEGKSRARLRFETSVKLLMNI